MKKIYKNPTTEIVNIEMAQMIAASEITVGVSETPYDGEQIESRRGSSLWDDDEE